MVRRDIHSNISVLEIVKKAVQLSSDERIEIAMLLKRSHYASEGQFELRRRAVKIHAVAVKVYQTEYPAFLQDACDIFHYVETLYSEVFKEKSDPDEIELPKGLQVSSDICHLIRYRPGGILFPC